MRLAALWVPPILWSAVILAASSDLFAAENTGGVLASLLGRVVPEAWLGPIHFGIRKAAHLVEYAILGALAFRAARADLRRPLLVALAIALAVAVADEWRQSRSAMRTGSAGDVAIDMIGAAVAIAFMALRRRASDSDHVGL